MTIIFSVTAKSWIAIVCNLVNVCLGDWSAKIVMNYSISTCTIGWQIYKHLIFWDFYFDVLYGMSGVCRVDNCCFFYSYLTCFSEMRKKVSKESLYCTLIIDVTFYGWLLRMNSAYNGMVLFVKDLLHYKWIYCIYCSVV